MPCLVDRTPCGVRNVEVAEPFDDQAAGTGRSAFDHRRIDTWIARDEGYLVGKCRHRQPAWRHTATVDGVPRWQHAADRLVRERVEGIDRRRRALADERRSVQHPLHAHEHTGGGPPPRPGGGDCVAQVLRTVGLRVRVHTHRPREDDWPTTSGRIKQVSDIRRQFHRVGAVHHHDAGGPTIECTADVCRHGHHVVDVEVRTRPRRGVHHVHVGVSVTEFIDQLAHRDAQPFAAVEVRRDGATRGDDDHTHAGHPANTSATGSNVSTWSSGRLGRGRCCHCTVCSSQVATPGAPTSMI